MRIRSTFSTGDSEEHRLLEDLYLQYRKQMFLAARSLLDNDADAEDAVHDVFLRISQSHLPRLRRIGSKADLRNYLLKAAKNTAISILRKKSRLPVSLDALGEESLCGIADLSDTAFLDKICERAEYEDCVRAIDALPPAYRDVLYYHFVLEFSIPEVAQLLNRKRSTVKQQLVRGKKLLIKKLKEEEFYGGSYE